MITRITTRCFRMFTVLLFPSMLYAQSAVLEDYVKEGIKSNLTLRQENLELEKSMETLTQVRALYMPRVYLNATYTLAYGGRRLQFPVGDLLNPVYATLNQMTGTDKFPSVQNVDIQLAPNNFQETTIAFQQSIFNSDIYFSYKIQKDLVSAQLARRNVYENELRYTIVGAYYQYLQTLEASKVLTQSKTILQELLKLNQKLVANNTATKDVVFSSEYEISKIEQQLAFAEKNEQTARSYFNFLLNRDLASSILVDSAAYTSAAQTSLTDLEQTALSNRQEIQQINHSIKANENNIRLNRNNRLLPNVFVGGSVGYQGYGYTFDSSQQYAIAQFGLQWNIFKGGEKRSKEQQSRIQANLLSSKFTELQQQIRLQVTQAYYDLQASRKSLTAAEEGLNKALQSFRIIDSRYRNNQALLVEFLRAENDVTTARLSVSIARYDLQAKQAQLNKVIALQ
ncbi:TolC family protein [Cytophagaceae bacterium DM2B3-1]|uniref:TolC family protein n=1 Tax=Xanthocytophaga flava TaxID=3048013 RepID=A0ABT7CDQ1_9BACT|nr:TolC family protein [Xanthocytophaga flavus]MDJ1491848.1 TolC family protein [Xanthocytophaga flavus]